MTTQITQTVATLSAAEFEVLLRRIVREEISRVLHAPVPHPADDMHPEDYLDFQTPNSIRLRGHRIGLEHILELYCAGVIPEDIPERFIGKPDLKQVQAAITYYHEHQAEVEEYLEHVNTQFEQRMQEADARSITPEVAHIRALRTQLAQQHEHNL